MNVKAPAINSGDDTALGAASPLERSNILIVDDRLDKRVVFRTILEELDQNIVTASSGEEALRWLLDNECAVILLDVNMPGMDGLETMKEIRKIPKCKDLPIVAVTAKAMKGDRERCIEAGAWDYLSKPVDREQLLSVLKAWLQR